MSLQFGGQIIGLFNFILDFMMEILAVVKLSTTLEIGGKKEEEVLSKKKT